MATVLINYASAGFKRRQRMNAYSAIVKGGVDYCIRYQPHHLSADFTDSNRFLMSASRGAGLYIWKPHIILDAMDKTDPGDVIIYCDSGAVITSSLQPLAEVCRNLTSGVLGFEVGEGFVDRQWTKRDAFTLMKCDLPAYTDTPQLRGGTIVFVNCKASRRFVEQWSELVCQVRLVTDVPSTCGLPEYPDFKAHRHDQSLFSLLYKKHGFPSCEKLTGKHLGEVMQCHIKTEPSLMNLLPTYFSPGLSRRF
jgi:hypothetical protein